MKPIAWFDPSNGVVSTDQDSPLFTPLGQVWPLYPKGECDCGEQPEQEPVGWPCLIDSADFSENTITLVMQCEDYKVSAGTHWLSTVPPQRKPLTDDLYNELLFAVENKYTDETRHQTALRYIKQAEMPSARPAQAAHGIKENT